MNHFRKTLAVLAAAAMLAGCSSSSSPSSASSAGSSTAAAGSTSETVYSIGLAQLVDHPSLNTIRDAMLDEFKKEGYVDGENLKINYQNAAGKTSNLDSIMSGYATDGVDAIIAIATPTAMSAQNYADQAPVIFSAVSDPVEAGLVESLEEPGGNITGTSDEIQVDEIVDLMLELTPDIKTVGMLYNPGEANSVATTSRFKEYAESKGLTVTEKTGTDNTTMQQAAVELANSVDAMFSPNDNTVATGMVSLGQVARDAGVPYYVGADSMVETGGFATVGINYEDLGRESARMTIDVLNGANPATLPVKVFKDDLNVYINEDVLKDLESKGKTKVEVPASLEEDENVIKVTTTE
ncbi:ABC transporter substrate-binding protein [Erysipelotrichaceae bacterium RD49]|nr:ABC transporter substrate-binding protein [Erysipelotrichaceae bacterium RD49]